MTVTHGPCTTARRLPVAAPALSLDWLFLLGWVQKDGRRMANFFYCHVSVHKKEEVGGIIHIKDGCEAGMGYRSWVSWGRGAVYTRMSRVWPLDALLYKAA